MAIQFAFSNRVFLSIVVVGVTVDVVIQSSVDDQHALAPSSFQVMDFSVCARLCTGFLLCTAVVHFLRVKFDIVVIGLFSQTSMFKWRYYMNVVTHSYSAAFWDEDRWLQEVDWMALSGVNLPLAFTGE